MAVILISILLFLIISAMIVFFARLSYHYVEMFEVSPGAALEFQQRFSKAKPLGSLPGSRPEIAYLPLEQIKFLSNLRDSHAEEPKLTRIIDGIIWDLRMTLGLIVAGLLLALVVLALVLF